MMIKWRYHSGISDHEIEIVVGSNPLSSYLLRVLELIHADVLTPRDFNTLTGVLFFNRILRRLRYLTRTILGKGTDFDFTPPSQSITTVSP